MAGKGITFTFLSNTRGLLKGTSDAEDALEKVADAVDDIGNADPGDENIESFADAVKRATRKVEDNVERVEDAFDDLGRTGTRDLDRLERSLEQVAREARDTERAGRGVGDGFRAGGREANAAMDEFKDEALSNISETFSSFDGSVESLADMVQGTLGGVIPNLGPGLAIAGAAGAAAVGLIVAEVQKAEERAQRLRDLAGEYAGQLIEAGAAGKRSFGDIADSMRDLATETEDARLTLAEIAAAVEGTSLDLADLAVAAAGDPQLIQQQLDAVREQLAQYDGMVTALESVGHAGENVDILTDAQAAHRDQLVAVSQGLQEVAAAADMAAAQEEAWIAAGGPALEAHAEAVSSVASSIQDQLTEAGEAWQQYYDESTGALDIDAYLENIAAQAEAIEQYQANLATASQTLSQEALNYIQSMGAEAAPLLAAYVNAPLEQQGQLESVWSQLGIAASSTFVTELESRVPDSMEGPTITATTGPVNSYSIQQFVGSSPAVTVTVFARTQRGIDIPV